MWTALALIMTVLMGGIIAYNGDLIGRKYGKRRVTLFNLRPKHTAILITSVTGVLISAFTTAIVFLLVPQVRDVILHGEEAIQEARRLNKQIPVLKSDIAVLARKQQERAAQLEEKKQQLVRTESDLRAAERKLESEVKKVASVEAKLRNDEQRLRVAREETQRYKELNGNLASINKALAENETKLARSIGELESKNSQLLAEYKKKQEENRQIGNENQDLAKQNLALSEESAKIQQVLDRQKILVDDNVQKNNELTRRNEELSQKNQSLLSNNAELVAAGKGFLTDWQELLKRFESMRTKRIAIHGGEDLARIVVPAHQSSDSVRKYIEQLKADANQAAVTKGAKADEQKSAMAVQVVDKQFLTESPFGGVRPVSISEQDRINAVVHKLTNSDSPVCVLALAVANSPESEPAAIDFQPFNDWLVYPKGRQIGTRKMNAAEEPEKIYVDLMAFLKDVGQTAIEKGMIPRIDPATGAPEVGSLNWPELVRLVEKVRVHQGNVRITALALDDTKASDPLKLDFKIEASL